MNLLLTVKQMVLLNRSSWTPLFRQVYSIELWEKSTWDEQPSGEYLGPPNLRWLVVSNTFYFFPIFGNVADWLISCRAVTNTNQYMMIICNPETSDMRGTLLWGSTDAEDDPATGMELLCDGRHGPKEYFVGPRISWLCLDINKTHCLLSWFTEFFQKHNTRQMWI